MKNIIFNAKPVSLGEVLNVLCKKPIHESYNEKQSEETPKQRKGVLFDGNPISIDELSNIIKNSYIDNEDLEDEDLEVEDYECECGCGCNNMEHLENKKPELVRAIAFHDEPVFEITETEYIKDKKIVYNMKVYDKI